MRRIPRVRAAGVAVLAALTALLGVSVVPAAAAINAASTATAASAPTVTASQSNQAAGDIAVAVSATPTIAVGDKIILTVDDSDGGNCATPTDVVGFSGAPTVTATVASGTAPTFTVTAAPSGAACTAVSGGPINDQVVLTVNNAGTAGITSTVNITGIKYNLGSAVAPGAVNVTVQGSNGGGAPFALAGSPVQNAVIATVVASGNSPSLAISKTGGSQAISPMVLTEQGTNALPTGSYCVQLSGPPAPGTAAQFDITATPTVAVSPAGDTGTVSAVNPTTLTLTVTSGITPTASAFSINGVKLIPGTAVGPVLFQLFNSTCTTPMSNLAVATSVTSVNRLGGADRFTTAELIAENGPAVCNAIIARADQFPDALAGSHLAGALHPALAGAIVTPGAGYGPILLVNSTGAIPAPTLNALRNLRTKQVFVLGGTTAVSQGVADALSATASTATPGSCGISAAATSGGNIIVERVGGADRYETAKLVAERAGLATAGTVDLSGAVGTLAAKRTAILASGENFPDALAAGPMAFRGTTGTNGNGGGFPLLLTNKASLNPQALAAFTDMGIQQVIIVGGTSAVSSAVETALSGFTVKRIGGANRTDTAAQIATFERAKGNAPSATVAGGTGLHWGFAGSKTHANLARGDNFPDSLTGGPHAGLEAAPIVLTSDPNTLSAETTNFLRAAGAPHTDGSSSVASLDLFGGTLAISAAVATAATNAMTGS